MVSRDIAPHRHRAAANLPADPPQPPAKPMQMQHRRDLVRHSHQTPPRLLQPLGKLTYLRHVPELATSWASSSPRRRRPVCRSFRILGAGGRRLTDDKTSRILGIYGSQSCLSHGARVKGHDCGSLPTAYSATLSAACTENAEGPVCRVARQFLNHARLRLGRVPHRGMQERSCSEVPGLDYLDRSSPQQMVRVCLQGMKPPEPKTFNCGLAKLDVIAQG